MNSKRRRHEPSLRLSLNLSSISLCRDCTIICGNFQLEHFPWLCLLDVCRSLSSTFRVDKRVSIETPLDVICRKYSSSCWSFGESIWLTNSTVKAALHSSAAFLIRAGFEIYSPFKSLTFHKRNIRKQQKRSICLQLMPSFTTDSGWFWYSWYKCSVTCIVFSVVCFFLVFFASFFLVCLYPLKSLCLPGKLWMNCLL